MLFSVQPNRDSTEKISHAKAQRRKALPRFSRVSFAPLRLCVRNISFPKCDEDFSCKASPTQGIPRSSYRIGKFHRQIAESYTVAPVVLLDPYAYLTREQIKGEAGNALECNRLSEARGPVERIDLESQSYLK